MSDQQCREKISIQMASALLADLRILAKAEHRSMTSLIEEAVGKLLDERQSPTISVENALKMSIDQFGPLYSKLAD